MPILFSAIAKQKLVMYKYASCDGNFMEILEEVLSRVSKRNDKMTYSHGYYLFHYIIQDNYIYFCLTNKTCQRSRAFLFLNQIKRRFETSASDFDSVLAEEMFRYSESGNTITIRKGELDELNSVGVDNSANAHDRQWNDGVNNMNVSYFTENILGEKILIVQNENNLQFTKTSCVEAKSQEPIVISVKCSKRHLIHIGVAIIVILLILYSVSPLPIFVITIVYVAWFVAR